MAIPIIAAALKGIVGKAAGSSLLGKVAGNVASQSIFNSDDQGNDNVIQKLLKAPVSIFSSLLGGGQ